MTIEEAAAIVGAITTLTTIGATATNFLVRRWFQKHRDEVIKELNDKLTASRIEAADLRAKLANAEVQLGMVTAERDEARAHLVAATDRVTELATRVAAQDRQLAELREAADVLAKGQKAHDNRIRRALRLEGALWTQEPMAGHPTFRPLGDRRTPIVSMLNLKGGVGKTTLTAYLGWALAQRGYRVLLVDLDLQGSLSGLFVPADVLAPLAKENGRLLQHYLEAVAGGERPKLLAHTLPLPQFNAHSRLVATTDRLAYAELSQTVRWLLRVGGTKGWNGRHDGRMILRRALHAPGLYKKFDVVLMDCPPLLNLTCANALAASDYVLTPVTPSVKSIERVTPLLRRIMEVKEAVNPALGPLGLVVNNHQERELTSREHDLLLPLPDACRNVFGQDVYQFDTTIPQRVSIRDVEGGFVAPDDRLASTFEQLAEEFIKRLPACCRTPAERRAAKGTRKALGDKG